MSVLAYGILLFIVAFLIHLVIWRLHLPKKRTNALFLIFSFFLVLGISVIILRPGLIKWSLYPGISFFEIFQLFLLYTVLSVSYVLSYPAIEADSPTLIIIRAVFETGVAGLNKTGLKQIANNDLLILPRIKDMLTDNMVYLKDGKYRLKPKGMIMAKLFLFYRNIIKGGKGG